jgi:site-specific DNA recombinase
MKAKASASAQIRCAIYTRKSSEEGLEQAFNSLDAQREACQAYVLSQAGEAWVALPDIYDDGGFSGGSIERPALKRLLAQISAGRIDVVVVYKVDRLTRSLGDFAKIVDVLDAAGASFVSVTQSFNTTTSMGRLTLNVLLSFAQFEREVTGERIRDKIAASKAKGMWMGGNVPLGYDTEGRALVINPGEAETVRHIYRRYLELGSVHALQAELEAQGYRSKTLVSKGGRARGGAVIGRGALFHLLSNRLYLGEIVHKGETHPGLHPPIIGRDMFQAVQGTLAKAAGPKRRAESGLEPRLPTAPLTGLVFNDRGGRMSPVVARKGDGRSYRYYVSGALLRGADRQAGSLKRVPADALEGVILERLGGLGLLAEMEDTDPWVPIRLMLRRVEVSRRSVHMWLSVAGLGERFDPAGVRARLATGDQLELDAEVLKLTVAASLSRRGMAKELVSPDGASPLLPGRIDPTLLRALVQAEAWKRQLLSRKALTIAAIAAEAGMQTSQCDRILRLAFLAPDLKRAIVEGRAPRGLSFQRLREQGVADDWGEQRRRAGR